MPDQTGPDKTGINQIPILYSFRRCPYAIRARLAIRYSKLRVELREVDLKNKPAQLLLASPKGTVPVLVCQNKTVIDESLDIMSWALEHNDPQGWLANSEHTKTDPLILQNDTLFKVNLDHYKYADRFPELPAHSYRQQGEIFLKQLEQRLSKQVFLTGNSASLTDIAIFPFIRQFAYVDMHWFETSPYPELRNWLARWLESELFLSIMHKHLYWQAESKEHKKPIIF